MVDFYKDKTTGKKDRLACSTNLYGKPSANLLGDVLHVASEALLLLRGYKSVWLIDYYVLAVAERFLNLHHDKT